MTARGSGGPVAEREGWTMGTMSFLLPAGLASDAAEELERACVVGGPDNMPWPSEAHVDSERLTLYRDVDESGCLVAPWDINGAGRLMGASGTLIERSAPYHFLVEMARGKVNQLRCQAADWQAGGLQMPSSLAEQIRSASLAFGKAVTCAPSENEASRLAQAALVDSYRSADQLVELYIDQMFQARHQRQPRLDTVLSCRLGTSPLPSAAAGDLLQACNGICPTFSWKDIEPTEGDFHWETPDALMEWAQKQGLAISAGPLIDFSTSELPTWVWQSERDLSTVVGLMCAYVEAVVTRYRDRVRAWQLTAASNSTAVLALSEDELLWLTVQLAEAARQIDPGLSLIVGIAQPWGEYMADEDRTHSPFIFADTLIRSGLNLAALDLELIMGVSPRGSYCRDLLDTSRLLDLYTLLGVPLRVTLACPSAAGPDPNAGPDQKVSAGRWRTGYTADLQAEWATRYAALAACKPSVKVVQWAQFSDAAPHQFPHCGLLDDHDRPKPLLKSLQALRESHLR